MRSANDGTGIGLAILVSFIALGTGHVFGTIVSTEDGALEGIVVPLQKGNIYQFKKIPYAMPPVGPLRFSKPLKHPPWNNTLNATDFGPACIQSGSLTHPVSEDCLFLNVYVPHKLSTTANKSVMVWIHGGGYRSGSGMEYDGTSLALQGDVIVVTLNYRLGVFGFFSTGDSSARGNYGLWDQIEALKWIKSNIKYFGGNSDSITLFGESAGAFSVFHLALFPGNQNLFHRVIMQSGTFGFVQKDPFTYAQALGDHLQCSDVHSTTSLVSCLREVEATTLLTGSHIAYMFSSLNDIFAMPLAPVIDGELISVDPLSLLRNESSEELAFYKSLDVISGCNSAEGSLLLMVIPLFPDLFLPAGNLSEGIPSWVLKLFAQSLTETKYNNDSRILQLVYDKYTSTDIAEQGRLIVNFFSDFTYYLPMLESLLLHNRGGNSHANSFQYFFSNAPLVDFALGVLPEWFEGAGHGTEINYLFDNWGYLSGNNRVLSTTMMSYWTNFANNG
ncbi:carboxylesterase 4A-like [Ylistrum balloti]|uniref:carboxylesterase 4A-like n=1 Tax=Ylistrum balloti TaxID=509963 RepID=UPI002905822B|nr:carboxylesterase 4A-like [Ylistrum balloti]